MWVDLLKKSGGQVHLVKDLSPSGIVYYWTDELFDKISPDIPTIQLADEWRTRFVFSKFQGIERRHSFIDRRKDNNQRKELDKNLFYNRLNPVGRRVTDGPVSIDMDLAVEKLQVYYS
jgi:hypothetical protein